MLYYPWGITPREKFLSIYIRGPNKVLKMAKNENVQWRGLFPILSQFGCLVSEGKIYIYIHQGSQESLENGKK